MHFSRHLSCWSLRRSWSIACWCCSNYICILHLTPGFNILCKDNCKPRREKFEYWDLVQLILEISRYVIRPKKTEIGNKLLVYLEPLFGFFKIPVHYCSCKASLSSVWTFGNPNHVLNVFNPEMGIFWKSKGNTTDIDASKVAMVWDMLEKGNLVFYDLCHLSVENDWQYKCIFMVPELLLHDKG